jgi:hypothetical protein
MFLSFLIRALYQSTTEVFTNSNYDFLYGGWMEISTDEEGKFEKLPYAIKFWSVRGSGVNPSLPVFFSWYKGHDLIICRGDFKGGSPEQRGVAEISIHRIDDFLKRRRHTSRKVPKARWCPRVICHIILNEEKRTYTMLVEKDVETQFAYKVDSRTGATILNYPTSLITKIISAAKNLTTTFEIGRQSE